MAYLAYGVTVSVELDLESPASFPAVTVCNLNAYDTSDPAVIDSIKTMQSLRLINTPTANITPNDYLSELVNSIKVFLKKKNTESLRKSPPPNSKDIRLLPLPGGSQGNNTNTTPQNLISNGSNGSNGSNSSSSNIGKPNNVNNNGQSTTQNNSINADIGFKIQNVLMSCKFNRIECNYTDFDDFYSFEYGNCYTFNKKGLQNIRTVSTTKVGLELELYAGMSGKI